MVYVINTGKTLSRSDAFDDLYQPIWIRRPSSQVAAAFPAYVEEILTDLLSSGFDLVAWILVSAVSAVMLPSSNSHSTGFRSYRHSVVVCLAHRGRER